MEKLVFQKDQVIFMQGDASDCMYEVVSGNVGVFLDYGKDSEKQLTECGVGKTFGEMGLLDQMPRSATVVALEDVEVTRISTEDANTYFEDNADRAVMMLKQLSGRLRELTLDYMEACETLSKVDELLEDPAVAKAVDKVDAKKNNKDKSGKGLRGLIRKFSDVYQAYDEVMMEYYSNYGRAMDIDIQHYNYPFY